MSSTNRTAGIRHANDFYETPRWCTDLALDQLPQDIDGPIVDCGAGSGAITRALIDRYGRPDRIYAVEIDERHWPELERLGVNVVRGDFLSAELPDADLAVSNPPFTLSQEFVARAIELVRPRQGVACLLNRLSFIAGKKRREFHRQNPSDMYVLSKRPSFTGSGTDSCDYAWFRYGAGADRRVTIL